MVSRRPRGSRRGQSIAPIAVQAVASRRRFFPASARSPRDEAGRPSRQVSAPLQYPGRPPRILVLDDAEADVG